jgi:DNA helicase-2/ATP-dependent DNA helicase PcrA
MISRSQQKDTDADRQLYRCVNALPPQSFLMIAGAGSGKTTSLIKGLTEILNKHGARMKLRRQRVACITYTEVAAQEIWSDVDNNALVHVSTIHSFLWSLIRQFQSDIREWVTWRIDEKIVELRETAANFGPRVHARTRLKNQDDVERYQGQRTKISAVRSFTYGIGSNYIDGVLGHDDIVKIVPQFVMERPLMRALVAQQYPFVFVDESQDTMEAVVSALKLIHTELGDRFCIGFFGDPMQRIYPTGIGEIPPNPDWQHITKPENFRCPATVLEVANAIRRDGDRLVQTGGRMTGPENALVSVPGSAHLFVLPADTMRDQRLIQVRSWIAERNNDPAWRVDGNEEDVVKLLVIVHRMAAKRLGFGDLYSAMNDGAPDKFRNGFLDGTAWPVRELTNFVLPLVLASNNGDEFKVMEVLRSQSPLLARENLHGVNVAARLESLRRFTTRLCQMIDLNSGATNADVLRYIHQSEAIALDPKIISYLNLPLPAPPREGGDAQTPRDEEDAEELTKEVSAMDAFLACPASQFLGYYEYLNNDSPFSTQQGIKGTEFERVLVVLDDEEGGAHVQFSYEKYLGIQPLSEREEANRREGRETSIERTRRLFYVCCTRALKDLVVVLFTFHIEAARRRIAELGLFPADAIHLEDELRSS